MKSKPKTVQEFNIYAYIPEMGDDYIGTAYDSLGIFHLMCKSWEKYPHAAVKVTKTEGILDDTAEDKEYEADMQYEWFVRGNDSTL